MNPLDKIREGIQGINEGSFEYFDLTKKYGVTLNFIREGANLPLHKHEQGVISFVVDGEFEVATDGETRIYKKGEWLCISKGQPHSVNALTAVVLLELWGKGQ